MPHIKLRFSSQLGHPDLLYSQEWVNVIFLHLWPQKLYRAFRFGTLWRISCSYPRHSQLTRHSLMLANGRIIIMGVSDCSCSLYQSIVTPLFWPPSELIRFAHSHFIYFIFNLAPFWISETGQIYLFFFFGGGGGGIFFTMYGRNGLKFEVLMYPDHRWKIITFWSWSVDFTHFGSVLTKWDRSNLWFPCTTN